MKKKKNILLYVVDSLNYSHIKNSDLNLMPFLEELKKDAVYCENMYSQAPYTEAALMNLYCGQDVLENGGYMLRFKDTPNTIFDAMRQNGYITFCNFYEPQCYPSSLRRGIDYLYYSVGYDQAALWSYRLKHFSELFSQGRLDEKDYELLYEILDDNLMEWIKFTDCLLTDDESIKMIQGNSSDYNTRKIKRAVEREYGEFIKDKNEYVENILKQGTGHSFFHIPAYIQNNKVKNRRTMEKVRKEFTPLFKRIRRMDFILNIHNCRGIWKGPVRKCGDFIKHPSAAGVREFVKSSYLAVNELIDIDLYKRIDGDYDSFKNAPSARKSIEFYINWAAQYKNAGPHFACIHVNDAHNPETFFTYDSDDLKLLEFEKREVESILNQIPKDYSGSLTHELSLRYIDNTIKYMYEELERIGILKDTCVIITADHGQGNILDSEQNSGQPDKTSRPIFLVKSLKEHHEQMEISDAPVSQKQLLPTILQAFGAEYDGYGKTFEEIQDNERYERTYIDIYGGHTIQFMIHGHAAELENWSVKEAVYQ